MRARWTAARRGGPREHLGRGCLATLENALQRFLPLLLAGALAGLAAAPAAAQNMCSPSTAIATRYAGYPGSTPYSNAGTRFTSNCTGPNVDPGITPDPYAGMVFPVPGYVYGSTSGTPVLGGYSAMMAPSGYGGPGAAPAIDPSAYAATSVDPSLLYGPYGGPPSLGGYAYGGPAGYGLTAGYPGPVGYGGLGAIAGPGYPGAGPYGMAAPGYPAAYAAGYGYPAAPYGAAPGGYPPYPYPGFYGR
jgi:hypothetical protein